MTFRSSSFSVFGVASASPTSGTYPRRARSNSYSASDLSNKQVYPKGSVGDMFNVLFEVVRRPGASDIQPTTDDASQ